MLCLQESLSAHCTEITQAASHEIVVLLGALFIRSAKQDNDSTFIRSKRHLCFKKSVELASGI